ncbi:transcriptional regulator [Dolosigranulum pigrum]|uniref:helix-turn-helix domain-containing protein n=1 Tax=Dolosigranulum pigrum TaxID=29394 RepID=UPI000DC00157|nr:helix-turn-helix transcriptional regulator [Dolosigranulum pigrum]RAN55762.1 transcriptional regulator [Dolosigranulum pigrum]
MENKNKDLITIGNNIRKYRTDNNLSQEGLASKSDLHRTYIGAIERGERNFSILNLIKIAEALNVDVDILIKLKKEDDNNA